MKILVIEDHKFYRQALGLSKPAIAKNAEIFAVASFDNLWRSDLDLRQFSVAIVDPGVPPVTTASNHEVRSLRVEHVMNLQRQMNDAARLIILTGSPTAQERAQLADAGIHDYLSKDDIGLLGLRNLIVNGDIDCIPSEKLYEHYFTEHTTREALGFAVRQKVIAIEQAARALEVELEAISQYGARGMRRFRKARKSSSL